MQQIEFDKVVILQVVGFCALLFVFNHFGGTDIVSIRIGHLNDCSICDRLSQHFRRIISVFQK